MVAFAGKFEASQPPAEDRITNAADALVRALEAEGVTTIFGYPGGAIMPVYDALTYTKITHILARHEQGAAFAADGYARVSGEVGVCLATSGPGMTNLITAMADAYADSVPMVCIVGQVAQALMGTDAFQEVDCSGIAMPVVKHSFIVRDPADLASITHEAMHIARSGRPGPVMIEVPKDVAAAPVAQVQSEPRAMTTAPRDDESTIASAVTLIERAKNPLFYIGGGTVIAGATDAMRDIIKRTGIPAVATLNALGVMPTNDENYIGMLGMHGTRAANTAVQECDLLIAAGARFDDRVTGKSDTFAPHAKIIHMDVDASEISKICSADIGMSGCLKENLKAMQPEMSDISAWRDYVFNMRKDCAFPYDKAPGTGVYAPKLLRDLSRVAGPDAIFTCDVGQHQMWVAQHCEFTRPEAHISSGGLGAMGFGIPTGIGAMIAEPDAQVITITGDGSIMMNIQELATLNRYGLPLKMVLLDNSCLGMVRQWQTLFYAGNYSEIDLSDNPDFAAVARAFGLDAFTVENAEDVPAAIERLLEADGPILAHVKIDPRENVWPLVPPGQSISNMMEEEK